jgi:hypothetical protein
MSLSQCLPIRDSVRALWLQVEKRSITQLQRQLVCRALALDEPGGHGGLLPANIDVSAHLRAERQSRARRFQVSSTEARHTARLHAAKCHGQALHGDKNA